jgi:hypothetical protein
MIFGDTGFDFTDQVSTNISGFGIDTTPNTGKKCNGGGSEREAGDHGDDLVNRGCITGSKLI